MEDLSVEFCWSIHCALYHEDIIAFERLWKEWNINMLRDELGPSYQAPDLLRKLVAAGFYGSKNGKGFYLWEKGKKIGINPAVARYRRAGL